MADFLWISLILSIALTVGINLILWVFPKLGQSLSHWFQNVFQDVQESDQNGFRIIIPWKTMIFISAGLTLLLNLVFLMSR